MSEGDVPPQKYENFAIFKPNLRDLMHTLRYSETKKGLSPAFSVPSPSLPAFFFFFFFSFFQLPSFRVFYNLLTLLRGWFTPIGLIHVYLSLLLSPPFLSFPLSLSLSFSSFLFLFSLLSFFFSLSPCRFFVRRPPPCRTASDGPGAPHINGGGTSMEILGGAKMKL